MTAERSSSRVRAVVDLPVARRAEAALGAEIGLHRLDDLVGPAGLAQIAARLVVDGEIPDGRAVLRRHVRDRRAVRQGEVLHALAEEFDELADDVRLAQELGHVQHEIGRGDAALQGPAHAHADDVGHQEIDRLSQDCRLRLDAAHPPADCAEPRDHAGVGVRAHQRVGEAGSVAQSEARRQVFEVELMQDARARRKQPDAVIGPRRPFYELVALAVALDVERHVPRHRVLGAVVIDGQRVIERHVDGDRRADRAGIRPGAADGSPDRGEVAEERNARRAVQDEPGDGERHLALARVVRPPVGEVADMPVCDAPSVAVAHHRFQYDPQDHRQPGDRPHTGRLERRERKPPPRPEPPEIDLRLCDGAKFT